MKKRCWKDRAIWHSKKSYFASSDANQQQEWQAEAEGDQMIHRKKTLQKAKDDHLMMHFNQQQPAVLLFLVKICRTCEGYETRTDMHNKAISGSPIPFPRKRTTQLL